MFEKLFDKKKKIPRDLNSISLNEVSFVDKPANGISFLIVKSENGEQLNPLEELVSAERFDEVEVEKVNAALTQLAFLDDDSASAVGTLVLAVATKPEVAKNCEAVWPSISGSEQVAELPCLIHKAELNQVEQFIQKFANKAGMDEAELEVVDNVLEIISDLDNDSLDAVHSLLKVEFSGEITTRWPSFFKHIDSSTIQEPVKNSDLLWPTVVGQM